MAINLGWAVGGGLGGWIAGINYDLLFWTDGLTCLAAGVVLWLYLPVPAAGATAQVNQATTLSVLTEIQSPFRDKWFIAFVICAALYLMVFMQLFSIVPLFFKQILHMNESTIGSLMALNGVIIVFVEMALVYSLEQQKRSKISLIVTGVVLTAVSYVVLALTNWLYFSNMTIALLFIVVGTLSEMLAIPFIQSFTVERSSPATRGQYLALYAMGGALAQTMAPALGSQLVAHLGFSTHWLVVAGISLVSAGGFWWLGKKQPDLS